MRLLPGLGVQGLAGARTHILEHFRTEREKFAGGKTNQVSMIFRRPTGVGHFVSDGRGLSWTGRKQYGQRRTRRRRAALLELGRTRQHTGGGSIPDE